MFLDTFVRDRHGDSATGRVVRDRQKTISKSQTPSSKSQGSSKIEHPKGEGAFGARSGGDMDNQTSFDVFVGSESFLLANMRNGGVGTISATANVNLAAIYKLYAESKRRTSNAERGTPNDGGQKKRKTDDQKLEELQIELNVVRETFAKYPMIAALKQAIAIYADDPAWAKVRPPLVELTAEQAKMLAAELKAISFEMPRVKSEAPIILPKSEVDL
jgi:hypothetical protein